MTCVPGPPQYRLLDPLVGWSEANFDKNELRIDDPEGLRLIDPEDQGVASEALSRYMPPAWFARDQRPRGWWMLGDGPRPSLPRWDDCRGEGGSWIEALDQLALHERVVRPVALAVQGAHLALCDRGSERVFLWSWPDGRLLAEIAIKDPRAIAFAPWGGLAIAAGADLRQYDFAGALRAAWSDPFPATPRRMAAGRDGALWVASGPEEGPYQVDRLGFIPAISNEPIGPASSDGARETTIEMMEPGPLAIERAVLASRLPEGLSPTGLVSGPGRGVRLDFSPDAPRCFTRDGRSARPADVTPPRRPPPGPRSGTLTTGKLDSGIPRCEWHRARVDADIPVGSDVVIHVACVEDFRDEPDEGDWEMLPDPTDSLIQRQPAGRYLIARVTLSRSGRVGPLVKRIRFDFPRSTGLDRLPDVYRDNPVAEDFTARFLSLFDAAIDDLDRRIETFAQLLDPARTPAEALAWLGSMFGVEFDPSWSPQRRRALIAAMPALIRARGATAGLRQAIQILFDIDAAIIERPAGGSWGSLNHDARIRSTRLFGRSKARFRLGQSALGGAPLRGHGDPDLDPDRAGAARFTVLVPPSVTLDDEGRRKLDRLIAEQKPAHALHALRLGGFGLVVGSLSAMGIDTRLAAPSRPVLGGPLGNARLNSVSILRSGSRASPAGLAVGRAAIGIHTVLE